MASPSNHRNSQNGAHGTLQDAMPPAEGVNQGAELFLSNYRLGKTLGIGSFGKVLSRSLPGIHMPGISPACTASNSSFFAVDDAVPHLTACR